MGALRLTSERAQIARKQHSIYIAGVAAGVLAAMAIMPPRHALSRVVPLLFAVLCGTTDPTEAATSVMANTWQVPARVLAAGHYDEGVLIFTLQGLANRVDGGQREQPLLLLDTFELFNQYYGADRYWKDYLTQAKGVQFTNLTAAAAGRDLNGLLNSTIRAGLVHGTVLYEGVTPEPDGTRYVALTLCGLERLLPVTPALRAAHPHLASLPVRHDLRNNFTSNAAAYDFALQHLMPRVNRTVGWSAGRTHIDDQGFEVWQGSPPEMPLLGLDVAIARSGFMFNLSPNATDCQLPKAPVGQQCKGSKQEAALFDRVMAGLNGSSSVAPTTVSSSRTLPQIYGWTEAESEYTIRVSMGGGVVLCSGAPNLSFWALISSLAPVDLAHKFGRQARQAAAANNRTGRPPMNKTYITFQTNEGDTPKIVAGLFGGSWLNPKRGSVPVAWGVNLLLGREFPALMEYFADTATENDTFFGGTSGAGYVYPSEMPLGAFKRYAAQAQSVAAAFAAPPLAGDPPDWTCDIWNWGVPEGNQPLPPWENQTREILWPAMIADYAAAAPIIGAWTQQSIGSNGTTLCVKLPKPLQGRTGAHVPVSFAPESLWYPGSSSSAAAWPSQRSPATFESALDAIEARIRATEPRGDAHGSPTFTLIYGLVDGNTGPGGLDAVDAALAMTQRLPADRFEVVGAQEMARLSSLHCNPKRDQHDVLLKNDDATATIRQREKPPGKYNVDDSAQRNTVQAAELQPTAFWTFQEAQGKPKVSQGVYNYSLTEGDPAHPVARSTSGIFGKYAADFRADSPNQRLRVTRSAAPALTSGIAGPNAKVSVIAWIQRPSGNYSYGFLAGVWGDAAGGSKQHAQNARQYAIYFDLGACNGEAGPGHGHLPAPIYNHGLAAHISNSGGPTPGHPYCVTAACDPRPIAPESWHCVANVYDGRTISAFINGSLARNGRLNPYPYPGGIYSPEAMNRSAEAAEFGVGVSMSFGVNQYTGLLGGLAVFAKALTPEQVTEVCGWPYA